MRFCSEYQDLYTSLSTLKPDAYLISIWEQYVKLIDRMMKETTGISGILCGYYTDNIHVWINEDLLSENKYIWFNLYFVEIFADIYESSLGYKNRASTLKALIHKYWRDICDDGSEEKQELWQCQEYLFIKKGGIHTYNYSENTLRNVSIAVLYVMFHEYTHLDLEALGVVKGIVDQTDSNNVLFDGPITESEKIETACDFFALYILLNSELINLLITDNESKFETACIALCLNGIYSIIKNREPSILNNETIIEYEKMLKTSLFKRLIPLELMTKKAQNSSFPGFIGYDFVMAFNRACKILTDLIEVLIDEISCINNDVEEYERVSILNRPIFRSKRVERQLIWTHSTISK